MLRKMHSRGKGNAGFSLVELMIAMVVGLIVVGAVLALVVSMIRANNQTIQATRLTQELRATAAVIASEAKLADPSLYTGRNGDVGRMQAALDRARAEAARLTARWEELETKRDASTRT